MKSTNRGGHRGHQLAISHKILDFSNQYIEIGKDRIEVPVSNPEASVQERIVKEISDIVFFIISLQFKNILKTIQHCVSHIKQCE